MCAIRYARSYRFRVLLAKPLRVKLRDFKLNTFFTFYETFKTPFSKIGRSAASMAALRAGTNTEKNRSRYVKPSLEGRFLKKISDRAEKVLIRRVSSSNFAWYVTISSILGIPTPPSTSGDIDPKIKSLVGPKKYVSMTFRTSLMDLLVMTRAKKFIYDIKLACKG